MSSQNLFFANSVFRSDLVGRISLRFQAGDKLGPSFFLSPNLNFQHTLNIFNKTQFFLIFQSILNLIVISWTKPKYGLCLPFSMLSDFSRQGLFFQLKLSKSLKKRLNLSEICFRDTKLMTLEITLTWNMADLCSILPFHIGSMCFPRKRLPRTRFP